MNTTLAFYLSLVIMALTLLIAFIFKPWEEPKSK